MKCKPVFDRKAFLEEHKDDMRKIDHMIDLIKNDPIIKLHLGIPDGTKSNAKHEFYSWARRRTMIDPHNESLDTAAINTLYAEMIRARKVKSRAMQFANKGQLMGFIHKMIYLPQTVFDREIVGGTDLFFDTQMMKHQADDRRVAIKARMEGIGKSYFALTNVAMRQVESVIQTAENRLARAMDMRKLLKKNPGATDLDRQSASAEEADARVALAKIYRGDVPDKALSKALRLQRAVVLAMQGEFSQIDKGGREIRRPLRTYVDEKTGKRKLDKQGLMQALKNSVPELDAREGERTNGLMKEVTEFLSDFGELAKEGFKAERENMVHRLMRGDAMMNEADARKAIDSMMKFDEVDLYFPQKALSHIARLSAINNGLAESLDHRGFVSSVIKNGEQVIFKSEGSPHTRQRILDYNSRNNSMNLFRVINDYANEVVQYRHDNMLSLRLNDYVRDLWNIRNKLPKGVSRDDFESYIGGVSEYLQQFAEISKNSPTGGKLEEISKIMVAMKAAVTMGFWNPSTPLLNLAEGHVIMMTRAGTDYMTLKGSALKRYKDEIEPLVKDEFIEIIAGEQFMDYGESSMARMMRHMSEADAQRYGLVAKDTVLLGLQRVRAAVSKGASKAIVLQTKAENANRSRAFRVGASMEYDFIRGKMLNTFMGDRASESFTNADIKTMFPDRNIEWVRDNLKGTEDQRKALWQEYAKRRVVKAGYEFMYQTQWNYNQAARHFLEHAGPIPKMAMMFQHYPLSWVASWQKTYGILKSLQEAGGARAMFERDPRQRALFQRTGNVRESMLGMAKRGDLKGMASLGNWTNSEMMFALSVGMIGSTMMALRYGTGMVMGQFMQHPALEVVQDTIRYVQNGFNGEEEKNKALFWGRGVLNEFTGPFYSDFMDAVSLASLKLGIDDGNMPRWTADVLRGTLGFRPNELLLTQYGSRRFANAFDVMNESFLFGAISVAPKGARIATSIPKIGDDIYRAGVGPAYETLTGGKARMNPNPGVDDFILALGKSAGIRDEAGMQAWIEDQVTREPHQ